MNEDEIYDEILFGKSKLLEETRKNVGECAECGTMFYQGLN